MWMAPSPLWNEVMRGGDINGREQYEGIVCPSCFANLAAEAGIAEGWRLSATDIHVDLQEITPSGRVWNAETWLWQDRPYDGGSDATDTTADVERGASDSDVGERNLAHDGGTSRGRSSVRPDQHEHGSAGAHVRAPDAASPVVASSPHSGLRSFIERCDHTSIGMYLVEFDILTKRLAELDEENGLLAMAANGLEEQYEVVCRERDHLQDRIASRDVTTGATESRLAEVERLRESEAYESAQAMILLAAHAAHLEEQLVELSECVTHGWTDPAFVRGPLHNRAVEIARAALTSNPANNPDVSERGTSAGSDGTVAEDARLDGSAERLSRPATPRSETLAELLVELAQWSRVAEKNGDLHARIASALAVVESPAISPEGSA